MKKHVYLGMSGGVDSSVAAKLLLDQGYAVTGVYMKNWTQDLPGMKCPWADDLADAKRVAVQLDIPFKVYDFQAEYRDKVVGYMIDEYKAGRTPNPDIMCNQEVKFKLFLEAALADGADMIATGHYARVEDGRRKMEDGEGAHANSHKLSSNSEPSAARLLKAADTLKDQTYFLYRIAESALARTLFPLGDYTKPQVRELAHTFGLATADKKDSQGICFVGKVGIKDFLSEYVETKPGEIRELETDKVVGMHDGALFYTTGQRHGLGLGGGLPYYVATKDMQRNVVYVTRKLDDSTLWTQTIRLGSLHWINQPPRLGQRYATRSRHRAELVPAILTESEGDIATLRLEQPQRAVTAGQSTVLYDGDVVVGGGIVLA